MSLKWLAVVALVAVPMLAQAERWLLMVPPVNQDVSAAAPPLVEWVQWRVYDTASACEKELAGLRGATTTEYGQNPDAIAAWRARCLPASEVPVR
jgi:hypothetical protein